MRVDSATCDCTEITPLPVTGELVVINDVVVTDTIKVEMFADDTFTLREWGNEGVFLHEVHEFSVPECLEVVDVPYKDQYYAQVTLKAKTIEVGCKFDYTFGTDVETTPEVKFELKVWPSATPEEKGTLILLDTWMAEDTIAATANEFITVRVVDHPTTGFTWVRPTQTWNCVELIDQNYGEYVTGFEQWLFQAKNTDTNCEETVTLTHHAAGLVPTTFTLSVERGFCPPVECAALEIVDLDIKSCECKPLEPA
jgi:hypothetical protein